MEENNFTTFKNMGNDLSSICNDSIDLVFDSQAHGKEIMHAFMDFTINANTVCKGLFNLHHTVRVSIASNFILNFSLCHVQCISIS